MIVLLHAERDRSTCSAPASRPRLLHMPQSGAGVFRAGPGCSSRPTDGRTKQLREQHGDERWQGAQWLGEPDDCYTVPAARHFGSLEVDPQPSRALSDCWPVGSQCDTILAAVLEIFYGDLRNHANEIDAKPLCNKKLRVSYCRYLRRCLSWRCRFCHGCWRHCCQDQRDRG